MRFHYLNNLKEATALKNGTAKEILNLSTKETKQLLEIISNPNKMYKDFWTIQEKIFGFSSMNLSPSTSNFLIKLPIKIVFNQTNIILTKPLILDTKESFNYDLKQFILTCFDIETSEKILTNCANKENGNIVSENAMYEIIIYSELFDLNTPMVFLCMNFMYLDMFLYINIVEKTK